METCSALTCWPAAAAARRGLATHDGVPRFRLACYDRYDFRTPQALPAELLGTFDLVVIDPPCERLGGARRGGARARGAARFPSCSICATRPAFTPPPRQQSLPGKYGSCTRRLLACYSNLRVRWIT
jgi:hypothetical protein